MITKIFTSNSPESTTAFGEKIGRLLKGGEVMQLVSDVGGGKTTLVKGIAKGMGSDEVVQSPTFIISAVYECTAGKRLYHYDFYRLNDAGIMRDQLVESIADPTAVTIIEWGGTVSDVISDNAITVTIRAVDEQVRQITLKIPKELAYITNSLEEAE